MTSQRTTRRSLLRAGSAVLGAISLAGCSNFLQPHSPVSIGRTSEQPVVADAPNPDGPLLYGTVINSKQEEEDRIDWRAFNELIVTDRPEEPPDYLREIPYGRACLTVLTTQFDVNYFQQERDADFEPVPVTFHGGSCTIELEFSTPPPLLPSNDKADEPRYYTQIRLWEMTYRSSPTDATVEFVVDTSN